MGLSRETFGIVFERLQACVPISSAGFGCAVLEPCDSGSVARIVRPNSTQLPLPGVTRALVKRSTVWRNPPPVATVLDSLQHQIQLFGHRWQFRSMSTTTHPCHHDEIARPFARHTSSFHLSALSLCGFWTSIRQIPAMSKTSDRGSVIVNSSVAGSRVLNANAGAGVYACTKAAAELAVGAICFEPHTFRE